MTHRTIGLGVLLLVLSCAVASAQTYVREDQDHTLSDTNWQLTTGGDPSANDLMLLNGTLTLSGSIPDYLATGQSFLDLGLWGSDLTDVWLVSGGTTNRHGRVRIYGNERAATGSAQMSFILNMLNGDAAGLSVNRASTVLGASRTPSGGPGELHFVGEIQQSSTIAQSAPPWGSGYIVHREPVQLDPGETIYFAWPDDAQPYSTTAYMVYTRGASPATDSKMSFVEVDPTDIPTEEWPVLRCGQTARSNGWRENQKNNFIPPIWADRDGSIEPSKLGCVSGRLRGVGTVVTLYLVGMYDVDEAGDRVRCIDDSSAKVTARVRYAADGEDLDDAAEQQDDFTYNLPCTLGQLEAKQLIEGTFTFNLAPNAGDYAFITFEIDHGSATGYEFSFLEPTMRILTP